MIVANYITNRPQQGETRTAEEFDKFLGLKSAKLGILAQLYPQYSLTSMTDGLWNIIAKPDKSSTTNSLDSLSFEWTVETNFIDYIEFAAPPVQHGVTGDISFYFTKRYYEKNDIFRIEESRQQIIVTGRPIRKADDLWEVTGRLLDNDYSSVLDTSACQKGMRTVWQSSPAPELSEEGYCKTTSNAEVHRNYITFFRNDLSVSSQYKLKEPVYLECSSFEGKNQVGSSVIYKMNSAIKEVTDNFMLGKSRGSLFNKTNINPLTGKCTTIDRETGQPIPVGEGAIPQIERWAQKIAYNRLTSGILTLAMSQIRERCNSDTGNHWVMILNSKLWDDVQNFLGDWLANFKTDGGHLWSQKDGMVSVGATYYSYEFGGNILTFKVDRAMTQEYGNSKGYGILLDLTADLAKGKPAITTYTLKGKDFMLNELRGVGIESGAVSSRLTAMTYMATGYAGACVAAPFRSVILFEV